MTTYEDLYALCYEIGLGGSGESDDARTTPFLNWVESNAGDLVDGANSRARIFAIGELAAAAIVFIRTIVAGALHAPYIEGLDLIKELAAAPKVTQVNIVTLNHDTLVEQLLVGAGVEFVDGFGPPDGDVRWHDDDSYDTPDFRVSLIKLHGSIDWYEYLHNGRSWPAMVCCNDPRDAIDSRGTRLELPMRTPKFLTGGRKEAWYQQGIYADLHFRFHRLLRSSNRIVMSGYGWGDIGINHQLDRWFEQRSDNKLVLLHEAVDKLRARSRIFEASHDGLVRRNQLTHVPQWMSKTSLKDIEHPLGLKP